VPAGPPLDLPARAAKPRDVGLTCLMDRGLALAEVDGLMEVAGSAVDIVKLGFGTAVATENLAPKLERYRSHGVPVVLGGTLTEIAILQGRVDAYVAWVRELGLDLIEVSDGSITLDPAEKRELITRLAGDGFTVMSEVGSKDNAKIMAPYKWVEQIQAELEAGAWKVICEGRETGTAGIARPDGELRQGLIDEIAHAVDPARLVFEAPQKDQQVELIRRFGPDVNLGNIPPAEVLPLETMRLGLRNDTLEAPR
jgi:phosphosulfolactate synthase